MSDTNFVFDLESASPYWILSPDSESLKIFRFVDTTSRISIIGYKHAFANLPGTEVPSINLKIFSSENKLASDSEWLQIANVSQENTVLFLRDAKRYFKAVVEIDSDSDVSSANFMLLVQIEISDIISPVITDHSRNVLSRFPSWTKIYADSLQRSTPETALPTTNAGRVINAILGEDLEDVDVLLSRIELDSFISSSDENQHAWIYAYSNIKPGFIKVTADYFEMSRVSSMRELLEHRVTDFVFYYNFLTAQLFTLFKPDDLKVDGVSYSCDPIQQINSFDEFGLRVGIQRLYLESNSNFKKRILDVYQNPPAINAENLKRTLRRELDIWRAYGSTPDSFYLGATPEVLEISDIERDERYFNKEGVPTEDFRDFVEYLNKQYPSNFGYIKWGESYWDPAGKRREGFSSIPQISDSATPEYYLEHYQPGIGDFNDIKIRLETFDAGSRDYNIGIRAHGIRQTGTLKANEPIDIVYDSYISYYEDYVENQAATVNYDITLNLNSHGTIPANSNYKARYSTIAKNMFDQTVEEYVSKNIFNPMGFTSGESIYYNNGGTPYSNVINPNATESYFLTEIPLYAVNSMAITFVNATNESGATGNYGKIGFLDATPASFATNLSPTVTKTVSQINNSTYSTKIKVCSSIYDPKKRKLVNTPKIRSDRFGNQINKFNGVDQTSSIQILPGSIIKNFTLPYGATPAYVHIENVVEGSYDVDLSASPYQSYGGLSHNAQNNLTYLIPSNENIRMQFVSPNFSTPHLHDHYINTVGSTVNYRFIDVKFPYNATPNALLISATPSQFYPFDYIVWEHFSADYEDQIQFSISDDGTMITGSTGNYDIQDNYKGSLIGSYDFRRSDFGLEEYASSPNLRFISLVPINENDDIDVIINHQYPFLEFSVDNFDSSNTSDSSYGALNYFDETLGEYTIKGIEISAVDHNKGNYLANPSIESGYIYQDGTPYYLYADYANNIQLDKHEIILPSVARQGAPIILQVAASPGYEEIQYKQVAFTDEATPSAFSYHNTEYIKANYDNFLALAYQDIFDVSVIDTYTNQKIIDNQSYASNIIETLGAPASLRIKAGRIYKVKYRVRNTFFVDNQYYHGLDNSYRTKINLLTTPNTSYFSFVHYEDSIFDSDALLSEVVLNPLYTPMNEGYLYMSQNTYPLNSLDVHISPKEILDDGKQFISLNLFSKDINGNPKPGILYEIFGTDISATPSKVLTDNDGYARAYVKYEGDSVATPSTSKIYVSQLVSAGATPNTSATVNYHLKPVTMSYNRLSAEVTKKIINADGQETVSIYGSATPNAKVYWRRGRNLYQVFNTNYSTSTADPGQSGMSGMTTAKQDGSFAVGPYRAQDDATPGYWFVSLETEMSSTANTAPNTVAGDIVYWYERYDVNQSNSSEPVLSADQGSTANYYHYLTNASFKKDFETEEVYYEDVFEDTWNLPSWYPISRYTQYQMGLLGSTPYTIDTYADLHPDYEEE